nr:aa3-type cytochrome c oxidase subunit IV [Chthonobacter albigriseus]
MDYNEHERTYTGFLAFVKYSTISIVVLLALMALFLV